MKFFGSWIAAAVPWTNYVYPEPYLGQSGRPWGRVFLVDVFPSQWGRWVLCNSIEKE